MPKASTAAMSARMASCIGLVRRAVMLLTSASMSRGLLQTLGEDSPHALRPLCHRVELAAQYAVSLHGIPGDALIGGGREAVQIGDLREEARTAVAHRFADERALEVGERVRRGGTRGATRGPDACHQLVGVAHEVA